MKHKRILHVPTEDELFDPVIYRRLWMIYRNVIMCRISRRNLLDVISLAFIHSPTIYLCYRDGTPFRFDDVDEIFGDDPDMRWISVFLEANSCYSGPKRHSRMRMRLIILFLFVKIKYPRFTRYLEKR